MSVEAVPGIPQGTFNKCNDKISSLVEGFPFPYVAKKLCLVFQKNQFLAKIMNVDGAFNSAFPRALPSLHLIIFKAKGLSVEESCVSTSFGYVRMTKYIFT